jgi:hypothetical protein
MKRESVEKLYGKLTPHEQTALSFGAAARLDEAELDAILGSVERVSYTCPHKDYQARMNCLMALSQFYGIRYWKTRAMMSMVFAHAETHADKKYQDGGFELIDRLAAMDTALVKVCATLKVDAGAVRKMAECEDEPCVGIVGNPESVKAYTEMLMRVVAAFGALPTH